jgi:uncharacterized coiled-coil protein SlyX
VDDLFLEPLPPKISERITIAEYYCTILNALFEMEALGTIRKNQDGGSKSSEVVHDKKFEVIDLDPQEVAERMCAHMVPLVEAVNRQKTMLLEVVQRNVRSITSFVEYEQTPSEGLRMSAEEIRRRQAERFTAFGQRPRRERSRARDRNITSDESLAHEREKRAAFPFIGQISESLFGMGRKEVIDKVNRDVVSLRKVTATEFWKIAVQFKDHQSIMELQDHAFREVSLSLAEQQMVINNMSEQLKEVAVELQELMEDEARDVTIIYSLMMFGSQTMTALLKTYISTVGSLGLHKDRSDAILTGFQKLAAGQLPIELVPADEVESALRAIDNELDRMRGDFYIAVKNLRFYYGIQTASFTINDRLAIMMKVPLTTHGAVFQNYEAHVYKLPILSLEGNLTNKYTKISGHSQYLAVSRDGLHYMEMDRSALDQCEGVDSFPKICNPVRIMNSIANKPSCTLALWKGDAPMMAKYCDILYYEQDEPDAQVYHVSEGKVLVTSNEGQFDLHCPGKSAPVSIEACNLCTIKVPCGCYIKSRASLMPPIIDGCETNHSVSHVSYPINLMLLSQLINDTDLGKYNGTVTFIKRPHIEIPEIRTVKMTDKHVIEINKKGADFKKLMPLAKQGLEAFLDKESFLDRVDSISNQIQDTPYFGQTTIAANIVGLIVIVISVLIWRKRKLAAQAALATVASPFLATAEALEMKDPRFAEKWPHNDLKQDYASHADKDTHLLEYWLHIRPMVYLILTFMVLKILGWCVRTIYRYLTTRLLVTPMNGMPAVKTKANVFLRIKDQHESMMLYIFKLGYHASDLSVVTNSVSTGIEIKSRDEYPNKFLAFNIHINSEEISLLGRDGKRFVLPPTIQLPFYLLPKFKRITGRNFEMELHAGSDGLFYCLQNIQGRHHPIFSGLGLEELLQQQEAGDFPTPGILSATGLESRITPEKANLLYS